MGATKESRKMGERLRTDNQQTAAIKSIHRARFFAEPIARVFFFNKKK
jgi:hypothetical protein